MNTKEQETEEVEESRVEGAGDTATAEEEGGTLVKVLTDFLANS